MSVHAVVGLKLLAKILADKYKATVLPNIVLVKRWQDLKALSQTLQCQTLSFKRQSPLPRVFPQVLQECIMMGNA